jgi:hypothetical protein
MTNVPDEIAMVFAAAQTQQQMAEAAIEQLKSHTQQLEPLVRETIRRALLDRLHALRVETDRALTGLQELHRAALPRAFWFTLGSAGLRPRRKPDPGRVFHSLAGGNRAAAGDARCTHGLRRPGPTVALREPARRAEAVYSADPAAGAFGVARDYYLVHQD